MKDFMLIFIGTNYSEMGFSPDEMQKRLGNWWTWQQKMETKGILKGGHALQAPARFVKGKDRVISDRASAEIKEIVGGYYIVSAKDLEEATEIAQDYPDYDLNGTVEIREVMKYDH